LGQAIGAEQVTLYVNEMPQHSHPYQVSTAVATSATPINTVPALASENIYGWPPTDPMPYAMASAGGGQPHNNIQPYTAIGYCIALFGVYPSPSIVRKGIP
jgi:microcystin-dependent protein